MPASFTSAAHNLPGSRVAAFAAHGRELGLALRLNSSEPSLQAGALTEHVLATIAAALRARLDDPGEPTTRITSMFGTVEEICSRAWIGGSVWAELAVILLDGAGGRLHFASIGRAQVWLRSGGLWTRSGRDHVLANDLPEGTTPIPGAEHMLTRALGPELDGRPERGSRPLAGLEAVVVCTPGLAPPFVGGAGLQERVAAEAEARGQALALTHAALSSS